MKGITIRGIETPAKLSNICFFLSILSARNPHIIEAGIRTALLKEIAYATSIAFPPSERICNVTNVDKGPIEVL